MHSAPTPLLRPLMLLLLLLLRLTFHDAPFENASSYIPVLQAAVYSDAS